MAGIDATMVSDSSLEYDMGAVIYGQEGSVTNLDFHREGRYLLMTTNECAIHIIDSVAGDERKKIYVKSCGVASGLAKFTHHEQSIIFCPERDEPQVNYLCIYDNRYLRQFKGHSEKISSLSMNPLDDTFLTAAIDRTVRIWDLRSPKGVAKLQLPLRSDNIIANYDESGVVFGVMMQNPHSKKRSLKLFDSRNYDSGPFEDIMPEHGLLEQAIAKASPDWSTHQIQNRIKETPWSSFEFSSDGNHILINTNSELLLVLDGFKPEVEPLAVTMRKNDTGLALGSCIEPNCRHLITANEDNEMLIFDYKTNESAALDGSASTGPGASLKGVLTGHSQPVGCIRHNPKYNVIASGCVNTVLWIPKVVI